MDTPYSIDFRIENHGMAILVFPLTSAAEAWVQTHLHHHDHIRLWRHQIVIEHRYIDAILQGSPGMACASS